MSEKKATCVLLTCDDPYLGLQATNYALTLFDLMLVSVYPRNEAKLTNRVIEHITSVDYLISFLSPVIIPAEVLSTVKRDSINFHPAPPAYPGVGSASYALYNQNKYFGVTAHKMISKVDAGPIIQVKRFPILESDTCHTLWSRARDYSLVQFYEVLTNLGYYNYRPECTERWERNAITRKEFEEWMVIEENATEEEIARKIKALRHPKFPGPFRMVNGMKVEV